MTTGMSERIGKSEGSEMTGLLWGDLTTTMTTTTRQDTTRHDALQDEENCVKEEQHRLEIKGEWRRWNTSEKPRKGNGITRQRQ